MKVGTKVKVIGVKDRNDKQVYGTIFSYNPEGLCVVDLGDKMLAVMYTELEVK